MAKLKLQPDPTFAAKVAIPVPGGAPVSVEFTFRHRNRAELKAFAEGLADRDDVPAILDLASGWELDDPFNAESLELLIKNYLAAARAIYATYFEELTKAKEKN